MVKPIDDAVQQCLKDIYAKDESHYRLVDSAKDVQWLTRG